MGVYNSLDIFQQNKYELFEGFYMVFADIYNALVINKHDFVDNLKDLEKVPQKIVEVILKVKM